MKRPPWWRSCLCRVVPLAAVAVGGLAVRAPAADASCSPLLHRTYVVSNYTPQNFDGISGLSETDLWTVGSNPAVGLHYDGTGWVDVGVNPTPYALNGVDEISPSNVWAVGADIFGAQPVTAEHWTGSSWTAYPHPGGVNGGLRSVSASGPNDVWAVGSFNDGVNDPRSSPATTTGLVVHWNGQQWTNVPTPKPASDAEAVDLYSVRVYSASDAWAVGDDWQGPATNQLNHAVIEHWNGTTWQIVSMPNAPDGTPAGEATDVLELSPSNIYIAGREVSGLQFVWHYDGTSWTESPAFPAEMGLGHFADVSPHDIWLFGWGVGGQGTGQAAHFDGASWSQATTPNIGGYWDAIAFPTGDIFIAGQTSTYQGMTAEMCEVSVTDSGYATRSLTVPQGIAVPWHFGNTNTKQHTVTDATGLHLYDSALRPGGDSYVETFAAAGTYAVTDATTGHRMTVHVPIKSASSGTTSKTFTITIAQSRPINTVSVIQIRAPGQTVWTTLTTTPSTQILWTPGTGALTGAYTFRTRLRNPTTGAASGWSPIRSIQIS